MEFFWLIVVTVGNEDEAENHEQERPGRTGHPRHSAQDAQAVFG